MEVIKIIHKAEFDEQEVVNDVNIFTIEELQNVDFDVEPYKQYVEDYEALSESLYVSIAVDMWRFCHVGDDLSTDEIIKIMQSDKFWYKNYHWTAEQRAQYEHLLVPIFVKWFATDQLTAWKTVQIWSGFGSSFSFEDYSREYFDEYLAKVNDLESLESEFISEDDVPENN